MSGEAGNPMRRGVLLGVVLVGVAVGYAAGAKLGASSATSSVETDRSGIADLSAERVESETSRILALLDPLERATEWAELMAQLAPENVRGASDSIDHNLVAARSCEVRSFVRSWATFDGAAAFEHVSDWKVASRRALGISEVSAQWAYHGNPLEVATFVRSLRGPKDKEPATNGLIKGWMRSGDVQGVTKFLSTLPDEPAREIHLGFAAGVLMQDRGARALYEWGDSIPEGAPNDLKRAVYRKVLSQTAGVDPEGTINWYEAQVGRPYAKDSMTLVATEWVRTGPEDALEWLMSMPQSAERDESILRSLTRWNMRDRPALDRWKGTVVAPVGAQQAVDESWAMIMSRRGSKTIPPADAAKWLEGAQS